MQMLDLLARVRNVCAHNERLYDYKYRKGTIDDTKIHFNLDIKKEKGQYKKGKNDLFAVVIVFRYLLEQSINIIEMTPSCFDYEYTKPPKEKFYSWVFANGLR